MPTVKSLTPYQHHKKKWENCIGCELCETRKKVVLYRGGIRCDILMIGEAPGKIENQSGQPFTGPAGILLDTIIERSGIAENHSIGLTNLVSCIPIGEEGTKAAEPPTYSIEACSSRLYEIVGICQPRLIVCVGSLSKTWAKKCLEKHGPGYPPHFIDILHPAAILRMDRSQKPLAIKRCIVALSDAAYALDNSVVPF